MSVVGVFTCQRPLQTTVLLSVRILLANLFQSSRSTFSCVSFPSVFAFQDDMWDTHISARGVRQQYRGVFVKNPVRMHARAGKGSPYPNFRTRPLFWLHESPEVLGFQGRVLESLY